jgi:hypothetical protein
MLAPALFLGVGRGGGVDRNPPPLLNHLISLLILEVIQQRRLCIGSCPASRVADLHHFNADPDRILISLKCGFESEFYLNADPDLINKKD